MGYIVKRNHGIRSLRGYQQGDLVEDGPGFWERRRQRARQSSEPGSLRHSGMPTMFLRQFAGDLAGNVFRDLGMERLGNLVGSREINAGDLGPAEFRALQECPHFTRRSIWSPKLLEYQVLL